MLVMVVVVALLMAVDIDPALAAMAIFLERTFFFLSNTIAVPSLFILRPFLLHCLNPIRFY